MVSISCWHLRHLVTMKKAVKEIYLQTCLDKQQSQKYCFCFSLKYILCILKAALINIFTLTTIIMNITEKGSQTVLSSDSLSSLIFWFSCLQTLLSSITTGSRQLLNDWKSFDMPVLHCLSGGKLKIKLATSNFHTD